MGPASVVDTPEVAAAKQAHALAHAQADAAAAVQPEDLSLYDTPAAAPVEVPAPVVFAQEPIASVTAESAQQVHYVAAPVAAPPVVHAAAPEGSQYHSQDDIGQYSYGYSDPNSVKQEIKTADGVTRGAYSYVDANGIVQTVNYIADALGFRVGATNLPVHIVDPPVAAPAPAAAPLPVVQSAYTAAAAAPVVAPQVSYAYLPYATNYGYNLPATHTVAAAPAVVVAAAPAVVAAPTSVDGANSQFHAQDDLGQYNYGFANPTQTKQEVKTADGVTRGGYSYIDANGIVQTVNYISDAMGFRVAATNLPVHNVDAAPAAAPVATAAAPVAAAAAAPVVSAAVSAYHAGDVIAPQVQYSYLPYAQNYAYHTPATAVVKAAPSRPVVSVTHSAPAPVVHSAPVVQAAAPVAYAAAPVHVAPAAAVQGSQYHAQDDAGQYSFGYNDGSSVKQEIKTADGVIRGAYSYVDADGIVQSVNYIADALGFRVGATNLPVHHVDAPVEAAAPVQTVAAAAPVAVAPAPVAAAPVIAPEVSYAFALCLQLWLLRPSCCSCHSCCPSCYSLSCL